MFLLSPQKGKNRVSLTSFDFAKATNFVFILIGFFFIDERFLIHIIGLAVIECQRRNGVNYLDPPQVAKTDFPLAKPGEK